MSGKRVLSMVAAMALVLGTVLGSLRPAPVAAQADELSQRDFTELIETVQEDDPAFGPEDGELEHDPDIVTMVYAEQELADILTTATFANPYAGSSQQFDYGIQFRTFSEDDVASYLRFIVVSTGAWGIADAEGEFVLTGEYADLDDSRSGENDLIVYAEGPLVHVGINGDYVGSVEVEIEDPGDITVGTSFFGDSYQDGAVTEFADFTVWEIGGSGRSTGGEDEDEPADNEEDEDSSSRGPLGPLGGDDEEEEPTTEPEDEDEPTEEAEDEPNRDNEDEPTAEPEDEDEPSRNDDEDNDSGNAEASGALYESPTYGYSFRYDDTTWEISESSEDDFDTAILTNGSTLAIFGLPGEADPAACAESLLNGLIGSFEEAGITGDVETTDSGEIADGPLSGSAFVLVVVSGENEDGDPFAIAVYVSCGPHGDGGYSIAVRQFAAASAYDAEAELRDEVVGTILAAGEAPADTGDDQPSRDDEDEEEPTREPDDEDEPAQDGALYESPSHGYSLRYDDDIWEVTAETSDEGLDTLVLNNGISTLSFFGFPSVESPEACLEVLLNSLVSSFEEGGLAGEFAAVESGEVSAGSFSGAGFIEGTFTAETDDGEFVLAIYVACGPISGSEFYFGVRHFVLADAYEGEAALRDEIMASILGEGEAPADTGNDNEPDPDEDDEPSRDDEDEADSGDSGNVDSPNVSRIDGANIYTSPTYGFTVEIQPGFSVEEDTVANGYDTLVISNETARITVAGFASSNDAATCVNSIITNLNADASFSNVTVPADESGAPIRIDDEGFSAVPVYLSYTEGGQEVIVGRLYACFSFIGVNGGSATLVYAYEAPADIFVDEFDNIVAMLDLILVP